MKTFFLDKGKKLESQPSNLDRFSHFSLSRTFQKNSETYTPWDPENQNSLPTIHVQLRAVSFREGAYDGEVETYKSWSFFSRFAKLKIQKRGSFYSPSN